MVKSKAESVYVAICGEEVVVGTAKTVLGDAIGVSVRKLDLAEKRGDGKVMVVRSGNGESDGGHAFVRNRFGPD